MTRVLITGGCGFLGGHVARALAARDDVEQVVAADVREPERPVDGVVYEHADVRDASSLPPLLRRHRIEVVVHLAAIVNPGRDEALEHEVDVIGSQNVLAACETAGVRRLVFSSSGAAYGYHPDNPAWLNEDDPLRGNEEFAYSRNKRLVEQILAEHRREHPELEQVVLRSGTILGPDVANQITALWAGRRILKVRGSDSPFVFIWVDDIAAAFARAATDGRAGVFNVAGSGAMTVDEIAQRLGKRLLVLPAGLLGFALRIGRALRLTVHGPERVGFLRYRPVLSNDALVQRFGFTPAKTSRQAFEAYVTAHPGLERG